MKINQKNTKVKKMVEIEENSREYTITLNRDEADILGELCGHVGGDGPIREMMDELWKVLHRNNKGLGEKYFLHTLQIIERK